MKKLFMVLPGLLFAMPLLAQGTAGAPAAASGGGWNAFAMAIASGLCGLGQAKAVASCAEGMARNPGAAGAIRFALILGLALIESLALYTLVIILLKV